MKIYEEGNLQKVKINSYYEVKQNLEKKQLLSSLNSI